MGATEVSATKMGAAGFRRRLLFLALSLIVGLTSCASTVNPTEPSSEEVLQRGVLQAEAGEAQAAPGELGLQGAPVIINDSAASSGRAAKLVRTGDTLGWNFRRATGYYNVSVRARGQLYQGAPKMRFRSAGKNLGEKAVGNRQYQTVSFGVHRLIKGERIEVVFTNDKWGGSQDKDRNLVIDHLAIEPVRLERLDITLGSANTLELEVKPGESGRQLHGVRFGCTVSHFSYDDPVIYPGQPNKAHLHMFSGNVSANANSTATSLNAAGRSSCEGGASNLSAYWMPALFNENGEPTLPEFNFVYYKTFLGGDAPDVLPTNLVKPIPDGLQLLASADTANYAGQLKVSSLRDWRGRGEVLTLSLSFPACLAVHSSGEPVLDYRVMPGDAARRVNSHASYPRGDPRTSAADNSCPESHPYRIPTLQMKAYFDIDPASGWYLASDDLRRTRLPEVHSEWLPKGHSLHGDYIAVWDRETIERLVECNRVGVSCAFDGRLTDLLRGADGADLYRYVTQLEDDADRTPFTGKVPQMR